MKFKDQIGCPSCDQLLTELNYIRDVDMKDKDETIYRACTLIRELIDAIRGKDYDPECLNWSEMFYNEHFIYREPTDIDADELPF